MRYRLHVDAMTIPNGGTPVRSQASRSRDGFVAHDSLSEDIAGLLPAECRFERRRGWRKPDLRATTRKMLSNESLYFKCS